VKSRKVRARRQFWLKFSIWVFLAAFIFSVLGVALVASVARQ
jgi:hypothetical protein